MTTGIIKIIKELKEGEIFQVDFAQVLQFTEKNPLSGDEHQFYGDPSSRIEWSILKHLEGSSFGKYLMFFPRNTQVIHTQDVIFARALVLTRKIFLTPHDKADDFIALQDGTYIKYDSKAKVQLKKLSPEKLKTQLPLCTKCRDTGVYKKTWHWQKDSKNGNLKWKNGEYERKGIVEQYCTCKAGIALSYRGRIKRVLRHSIS